MSWQPILIGVYGRARSGKDTVAAQLARKMNLMQFAFAEPLKTMLKSVFGDHFHHGDRSGICPETGKSYREMMQTLGTEWGRNLMHPDIWINLVDGYWQSKRALMVNQRVIDGVYQPQGMILSDVRFDSEAKWIESQGGYVVEVIRPDAGGKTVGIEGHQSEAGISPSLVNVKLWNGGSLQDLDQATDGLLELLSLSERQKGL